MAGAGAAIRSTAGRLNSELAKPKSATTAEATDVAEANTETDSRPSPFLPDTIEETIANIVRNEEPKSAEDVLRSLAKTPVLTYLLTCHPTEGIGEPSRELQHIITCLLASGQTPVQAVQQLLDRDKARSGPMTPLHEVKFYQSLFRVAWDSAPLIYHRILNTLESGVRSVDGGVVPGFPTGGINLKDIPSLFTIGTWLKDLDGKKEVTPEISAKLSKSVAGELVEKYLKCVGTIQDLALFCLPQATSLHGDMNPEVPNLISTRILKPLKQLQSECQDVETPLVSLTPATLRDIVQAVDELDLRVTVGYRNAEKGADLRTEVRDLKFRLAAIGFGTLGQGRSSSGKIDEAFTEIFGAVAQSARDAVRSDKPVVAVLGTNKTDSLGDSVLSRTVLRLIAEPPAEQELLILDSLFGLDAETLRERCFGSNQERLEELRGKYPLLDHLEILVTEGHDLVISDTTKADDVLKAALLLKLLKGPLRTRIIPLFESGESIEASQETLEALYLCPNLRRACQSIEYCISAMFGPSDGGKSLSPFSATMQIVKAVDKIAKWVGSFYPSRRQFVVELGLGGNEARGQSPEVLPRHDFYFESLRTLQGFGAWSRFVADTMVTAFFRRLNANIRGPSDPYVKPPRDEEVWEIEHLGPGGWPGRPMVNLTELFTEEYRRIVFGNGMQEWLASLPEEAMKKMAPRFSARPPSRPETDLTQQDMNLAASGSEPTGWGARRAIDVVAKSSISGLQGVALFGAYGALCSAEQVVGLDRLQKLYQDNTLFHNQIERLARALCAANDEIAEFFLEKLGPPAGQEDQAASDFVNLRIEENGELERLIKRIAQRDTLYAESSIWSAYWQVHGDLAQFAHARAAGSLAAFEYLLRGEGQEKPSGSTESEDSKSLHLGAILDQTLNRYLSYWAWYQSGP